MADLDPSDFGASLRAAREARGLTLQEISEATKISVAILEALEANDIKRLPGGLFSRSFVRAYASEVGLRPEATVAAFLEAFPTLRPDEQTKRRRDITASVATVRTSEPPTETSTAIRLALMSLPVVALLLFFGLRGDEAPAPDIMSLDVGDGVGEMEADPPPEAEPASSVLRPPALPLGRSSAPAAEPASGPLVLELHPTAACWVSLSVDGEAVLASVVEAGQRRVFEAEEAFVLNVGDAGLFDFTLNQQPGRSLGPNGQVVTVEITRDNFRSFVVP